MSNYKLTFKLKQHTPIIHFQHDQYGATLRASELKPKLDRFILKRLGNGDEEKGKEIAQSNGWLIGKGAHPALDYKVKIIDKDNRPLGQRITEVTIIPPNREQSIISNDLSLQIHCFNKKLKDKIQSSIEDFFISSSFGKRNSKGFGCFYIERDGADWSYLKSRLPHGTWIKESCITGNIGNTYRTISKFQRILKSGINIRRHHGYHEYIKSKLFVYNINNGIRWEKRWIKKAIQDKVKAGVLPVGLRAGRGPNDWCNQLDINTDNDNCNNNTWIDSSQFNNNYRFVRIILGLPEHWEFQTTNGNIRYKVIPESSSIERFKSSITFKVYERNIYVLVSEIPTTIFSNDFSFKVQVKKRDNNGWRDDGPPISLGTLPTVGENEFNLNDFLNKSLPSLGFTQIR